MITLFRSSDNQDKEDSSQRLRSGTSVLSVA